MIKTCNPDAYWYGYLVNLCQSSLLVSIRHYINNVLKSVFKIRLVLFGSKWATLYQPTTLVIGGRQWKTHQVSIQAQMQRQLLIPCLVLKMEEKKEVSIEIILIWSCLKIITPSRLKLKSVIMLFFVQWWLQRKKKWMQQI